MQTAQLCLQSRWREHARTALQVERRLARQKRGHWPARITRLLRIAEASASHNRKSALLSRMRVLALRMAVQCRLHPPIHYRVSASSPPRNAGNTVCGAIRSHVRNVPLCCLQAKRRLALCPLQWFRPTASFQSLWKCKYFFALFSSANSHDHDLPCPPLKLHSFLSNSNHQNFKFDYFAFQVHEKDFSLRENRHLRGVRSLTHCDTLQISNQILPLKVERGINQILRSFSNSKLANTNIINKKLSSTYRD